MVAKARLTLFAVAVLIPIFIVCINIKAFWLGAALLMVFFSAEALTELFILNFASDDFYEKHMSRKNKPSNTALMLTDAILICGAYALIMIMLFMSFFILESGIMKVFSLILLALWGFDLSKVLIKPSVDEEWSVKDTVREAIMWLQCVLSIVFAVISAFMI